MKFAFTKICSACSMIQIPGVSVIYYGTFGRLHKMHKWLIKKDEIDVEFVSFAFYCEAAKTTKTKKPNASK